MLLRYVILSLLRDEEMHGYRIKSAFEERVGATWPLNFGQIYEVLKDLRRRDLIVGRLEPAGSHMGRWVYRATARGRRSLATWLGRGPRPPVPVRNEILVRLLATGNDAEAGLLQLESQKAVYRVYLDELEGRRRELPNGNASTGQQDKLARLAIDAAIYQVEAHLRWLQYCDGVLVQDVPVPTRDVEEQRSSPQPKRKRQRRVCDVPVSRSRSA